MGAASAQLLMKKNRETGSVSGGILLLGLRSAYNDLLQEGVIEVKRKYRTDQIS